MNTPRPLRHAVCAGLLGMLARCTQAALPEFLAQSMPPLEPAAQSAPPLDPVAQSASPLDAMEQSAAPLAPAAPAAAPRAAHSSELTAIVWHQRHDEYFRRNWGLSILGVRRIASGYMLEFKYQILDADKAAVLNERRARAFLIDEATDTRLSVPAMENIGELRQASRPEEGRVYYILFGNPGKLVPKGGHVDVIVGRFRADGIVVE